MDYQRQRQPLSHDDAAFIAEMIELLITDLRDAGCLARHGQPGPLPNASNKVLYEGLRSRVGDRYNIWSTCWSESKSQSPTNLISSSI